MNEEDVLRALETLAEADRELEAPPAVEVRLRSAFRKKYQRRAWPYFAALTTALASFLLLIRVPPPPTLEIPPVAAPAAPVLAVTAPAPKVVHRQALQPKEVMTDFYPLMEAPPPFERGELLRVSLPASAMRTVGLPVSEDRLGETVQADVLVGEEGLARAIRFVKYER